MTPHTTQKESRTCADCHSNPKTVGLGEGNLSYEGMKWHFTPVKPGINYGLESPLDSCVNIEGNSTVNFSRDWLRSFNKDEINRILKVGVCLTCHKGSDSIFSRWDTIKDYKCEGLRKGGLAPP